MRKTRLSSEQLAAREVAFGDMVADWSFGFDDNDETVVGVSSFDSECVLMMSGDGNRKIPAHIFTDNNHEILI